MYISAVVSPVCRVTIGSCASRGSTFLTCWTFDSTSDTARSALASRRRFSVIVLTFCCEEDVSVSMPSALATADMHRRGDEPPDELGIGARIGRGDGQRRVGDLGILPHRQIEQRREADEQDQQAHHGGKHGPANEDVGERHEQPSPYCFGRSSGRVSGCVLSMRMAAPGLSLSWPVVMTCSPAATPERITTRSSRASPGLHEPPVGDELRFGRRTRLCAPLWERPPARISPHRCCRHRDCR